MLRDERSEMCPIKPGTTAKPSSAIKRHLAKATDVSTPLKRPTMVINAGYRGMYNKNIRDLKLLRKIKDNKSLLDYMGKDELAANLFRITQTELKIKNDNIHGQTPLEAAAHAVGKKVRETMMEISNVPPERLPVHDEIKEVKKQLKSRSKKFKQIDTDKKKEIDQHE